MCLCNSSDLGPDPAKLLSMRLTLSAWVVPLISHMLKVKDVFQCFSHPCHKEIAILDPDQQSTYSKHVLNF